ncbi:GNAT family N-acetyltransferase [Marixanthomonas spongiae]|uniref:GNAT family N-acetyltransferase n=1 Tax=Marixanthomonas spongiae TaxID=2174845 RepID=A0A2U0I639_9FLAO|nr:GNAT family N-acetyltransferase [Marixanthomonas spongiae]
MASAKNATFLFNRNFMDYHSDRFDDFSLLVYKGKKLCAVLPANKTEDMLISHQGLTYGGLVLQAKIKFADSAMLFQALLKFIAESDVKKLRIKLLPVNYHSVPAEEIQYLLQAVDAKRNQVAVASAIDLQNRLKIQSNRMEGVKKAHKHELQIQEGKTFEPFWEDILAPNLKKRFGASPVHSLEEIKRLGNYFPENIHQFNVLKENKIVAGATVFETDTLVHTQYISANRDKQQLGSLDFLFHYLITDRFKHKRYFDFGTSNEQNGKKINAGLQYWKECFGARTIVYEQYEVNPKNHFLLNSIGI